MDICPQAFGLEAVSLKSHGTVEAPAVPAVPDPVKAEEEEGDFSTALEMTEKTAPEMTERGSWWKAVLWVVVVVAVLLGMLAVLGRVAPDFVDRFLYTKEELEVLRDVL